MMRKQQWFFVFLYLLAACNVLFIILAMSIYVLTDFFLYLMYAIPFELSLSDTLKYIKAASFAGSLVAIGSWWIYYQHYRKNRSR
jgi:hypothetical protein